MNGTHKKKLTEKPLKCLYSFGGNDVISYEKQRHKTNSKII